VAGHRSKIRSRGNWGTARRCCDAVGGTTSLLVNEPLEQAFQRKLRGSDGIDPAIGSSADVFSRYSRPRTRRGTACESDVKLLPSSYPSINFRRFTCLQAQLVASMCLSNGVCPGSSIFTLSPIG
jgi:hypothetical protein